MGLGPQRAQQKTRFIIASFNIDSICHMQAPCIIMEFLAMHETHFCYLLCIAVVLLQLHSTRSEFLCVDGQQTSLIGTRINAKSLQNIICLFVYRATLTIKFVFLVVVLSKGSLFVAKKISFGYGRQTVQAIVVFASLDEICAKMLRVIITL